MKQEERTSEKAVQSVASVETTKENANNGSIKPPPIPRGTTPTLIQIVEALLKSPETIISRFCKGNFGIITLKFLAILSLGFIAYGLVAGSFSMGRQLWIAPLKIWMGLLATAAICFPSFYIFACLGEAQLSLKQAFVVMSASLTLVSILLIGFMPVALVFSTSTNSIACMGFFHLVFWFISIGFGMRFLLGVLNQCESKNSFYIKFWIVIFFITTLQMMTAIRPIIGTSDSIFPIEKKFFLENWGDALKIKD
ncbi:MAG: hypothetical protein GXP32_07115 [Kiritimatiellaeota bacterium]|nr:hypothetical protein [Kiritimatiellota bacterium]